MPGDSKKSPIPFRINNTRIEEAGLPNLKVSLHEKPPTFILRGELNFIHHNLSFPILIDESVILTIKVVPPMTRKPISHAIKEISD